MQKRILTTEFSRLTESVKELTMQKEMLICDIEDLSKEKILKKINTNIELGELKSTQFVDISDIDKSIKQMQYFKRNYLYTEDGDILISQDYDIMALRLGTALKLSKAADLFKQEGYGILLYDAYRSYDVQAKLREHYKYLNGTYNSTYVAKPGESYHQKGTAVDISLFDLSTNKEIEMPTTYLTLNSDSRAVNNQEATITAAKNLKLIQDIMKEAGFSISKEEWWQFNDMEITNKVNAFNGSISDEVYVIELSAN